MLVLPISVQGKITGVLRLLARSPKVFHQDEIEFASALAEQCGIAIQNARIYEEQKRQLSYFKALNEIGKAINATYELGMILDLIVRRLPEVMHLKACTIRLMEASKGGLELKAAYGLSRSYLERGPLDAELATHYILEGDPVVITDAKTDLHAIYHKEAAAEGIGSVLAVPIAVQKERRSEGIHVAAVARKINVGHFAADFHRFPPVDVREQGHIGSHDRTVAQVAELAALDIEQKADSGRLFNVPEGSARRQHRKFVSISG